MLLFIKVYKRYCVKAYIIFTYTIAHKTALLKLRLYLQV